jgi:DNA-binding SARP family transcriptional activator/predicted negative regulator of RcsB-dependent stress response
MMLLDVNRLLPTSRLVDALWDERPPTTAKSQVQICVSALRRQLATVGRAEAICTRTSGYILRTDEDEVDVKRFERLAARGGAAAAQGRNEDALRDLRAALDCWHASAAAAGVQSRIVQAAAARLNEQRLAVLEECMELELAQGRTHDLVGELGELVAEHPLRERLRTQHMIALYRSGRQVEALSSYREARRILVEELGLEPSEALQNLERAILRNDPSLDAATASVPGWSNAGPAHVPRQLPTAAPDFTGREDMLEQLLMLLTPSDEPDAPLSVSVVTLSGKSGVGKTTLALRAAHALREFYPDGQLFAELHGAEPHPVNARHVLEQFLRALGTAPGALPTSPDELAAMYRTKLADRRVLVVLDDASSVTQVTPLIPGSPKCAVIVTARTHLTGLPCARRFEIDVFDEHTGVELLARVIGEQRVSAESAMAADLVRLCGALPLALRIGAAKLAARPHWTIRRMVTSLRDEEHRLNELMLGDVGVRASISLSYANLSVGAQRLLQRLSVLGSGDFGAWVCMPLLDMDVERAPPLLDELIEALLVEVRVAGGAPRFRLHELIRVYALERLVASEAPQERALALRRLLACWLSLASAAHRKVYGGDFTVLHGSEPLYCLPEDVTSELVSDPLAWFVAEHRALVSALTSAARAGFDELCWDLAVTSVTLFEARSYLTDWEFTHELALEAVRYAGNERGEAAVHCSLGALAVVRREFDVAIGHLDASIASFTRLGDRYGRGLAQRHRALVDRMRGAYGSALRRYEDALACVREAGDRICEAQVLSGIAQVHIEQRDYLAANRLLDEALAISRALGVRRVTAQIEHRLGEVYLERGDLEAAEQTFNSALEAVSDRDDRVGEAYALYGLGLVEMRQRRFGPAELHLQTALAKSVETTDQLAQGQIAFALAELEWVRGQPAAAAQRLHQAQEIFGSIGCPAWHARVLEMTGQIHEQEGRASVAAEMFRAGHELIRDQDPVAADRFARALARLGG